MSQRVTAADTLRFTGTFEYQGPAMPPPRVWTRIDIGKVVWGNWREEIRVEEDIGVPERVGWSTFGFPIMDVPLAGLGLGVWCIDVAIRVDHPTPGFPDRVWNLRMTDAIEVVAELPDGDFRNLDVNFRTL